MFTLGNKEIIINSSSKFKTEIKTINGTEELAIQGFGSFKDSQVLSVTGQRFIAGRDGGLNITSPFAVDLGVEAPAINVPVVVHIRVNTTRHSSEWAVDFIKRGRPFIFELLIDGGESNVAIAIKLMDAFKEYEAQFNWSDRGLPFTYVRVNEIITLVLKDPYLSFQESVVFLPRGDIYGVKVETTTLTDTGATYTGNAIGAVHIDVSDSSMINVGDIIGYYDTIPSPDVYYEYKVVDILSPTQVQIEAPGLIVATTALEPLLLDLQPVEPTWDGKYLEENVRMSTPSTSDSYGISPDEKPIIKGSYTSVTFRMSDDGTGGINIGWKKHRNLGVTRGEVGGPREFTFTTYILEGTDMFGAGEKVDTITQFLLTYASESHFYVHNGVKVATIAEFIA